MHCFFFLVKPYKEMDLIKICFMYNLNTKPYCICIFSQFLKCFCSLYFYLPVECGLN